MTGASPLRRAAHQQLDADLETSGATALAPRRRPAPQVPGRPLSRPTPGPDLRAVPTAAKRPSTARPSVPRSHRWKRTVRTLGALFGFSIILSVAFGAIAMHSQLASRQIHLNSVRTDLDLAERDHQMLRLQVAELDTPEQVVSAAYRLGLVGATEVEFLPTASTVVPVSAGPAIPVAL